MTLISTSARLMALAAGLAASAAVAQQQPTGVWIDHTGRGAVEIAECAGGLCGHVVWVKDAKNNKACRTQIIGNVRSVGSNTWDRGWIVDPDDNARYSVELKPVGEDRLRVTGYMGSKLFSETMMWKRAPADLKRCDVKEVAAVPVAPPVPAAPVVPSAPAPAAAAVPPAPVPPPTAAKPAQIAPVPRIETSEIPAATVVQPQRQAAAPVVVPAVPSEPPSAGPAAAPAAPTAEVAPPAKPERRSERQPAKRKSASRECKLDLPYITVKYPCDAF